MRHIFSAEQRYVDRIQGAPLTEAAAVPADEVAEEMMAPTRITEGVTLAIVRAPGGVPIGLSGP